jgi:hypothetical protein
METPVNIVRFSAALTLAATLGLGAAHAGPQTAENDGASQRLALSTAAGSVVVGSVTVLPLAVVADLDCSGAPQA